MDRVLIFGPKTSMLDFIVIRDQQPRFLVEVKYGNDRPSPALAYFQKQLKASHAFQLVIAEKFRDLAGKEGSFLEDESRVGKYPSLTGFGHRRIL